MFQGDAPLGTIDLYWIPLGAGGSGFVRLNGRIYEWFEAFQDRRPPLAIYHTALGLSLPDGHYVVETMWPRPDTEDASRGVTVEGPVGGRFLARWRTFRYEVRCWRNGLLEDADQAEGGPQRLSIDPAQARTITDLATEVPPLTWGRDEAGTGEMWNSNSVIAWLLTRSGAPMDAIQPPPGGRAPGWAAGVTVAKNTDAPPNRPAVALSQPKNQERD